MSMVYDFILGRMRKADAGGGIVQSSGAAVPGNESGSDGDRYLRTETGDVYLKAFGSWLSIGNIASAFFDEYTQSVLHFNEPSGAFIDSANTRTIIASATYNANGKFLGSAEFDGTQYVHLGASPYLSWGTGDGTIDAWIYGYDSPNSSNAIVAAPGSWGSGGISISFDRGGNQKFDVWIYDHSSGAASLSSTHTFSRNEWHHVALVRSGTTILLFVDGTLEGSITVSASLVINWAGTGSYATVGYNEADSQGFKGRVDEVRISNIARWTEAFTPPTQPYGIITV